MSRDRRSYVGGEEGAAEALAPASPTPTAPNSQPEPPAPHPGLIALARLLARQAAAEALDAD